MSSELISLTLLSNQNSIEVKIMDLIKKFFILLAVFCVIGSAAAISAADVSGDNGGWAGSQYQDDAGGWAGSQYNATEQGGWAGSQYNATEHGGWAGSQYNATAENAANNATHNATNGTVHGAGNSTHNATNATSPHTLLATGNPILLLLGVTAAAGGYAALRRRN